MTSRPHVLFVDDEPRILAGLRRMLRTHRDRWDMSFAEGPGPALEILRDRPCDVVITDYRMPGMDGGELLDKVRHDHPQTARVMLSGQTGEASLIKIMALAHQFLTKPAAPEQLIEVIERLVGAGEPAGAERARGDVAGVSSLPSPPSTLLELVTALDSADASASSVAAVIEGDPAAAAKVLQLANSSAYMTSRAVSDVVQAVTMLGTETVRGLFLMHDLVRSFDPGGRLPGDWIQELTVHAVETARLAGGFAGHAPWQSHARTAGLLHEVGQLVLASADPDGFAAVLETWRGVPPADPGVPPVGDAGSLQPVELAAFGICHRDAGTNLLNLWGLPRPVIEAVAGHTGIGPVSAVSDPTSAVELAHLVVEAELGPVCGPCDGRTAPDEQALSPAERAVIDRWRVQRSRR